MSIYDDLKPVVSDVMDEFKQGNVKLIQVTAGGGSIDNPGAPTEVEHTLSATVKGVSFKFVKDGLAVSSDLMVTSSPVDGITTDENDFISIDSVRYKIIRDVSMPSAGTKLVWKFIVRKGG